MIKRDITILDLFKPEEIQEKSDGNYKTICPSCGLQGGRTEGFVLFPETNTWYCHSSGKHGSALELVALQNKIITCNDCNETKEKRRILEGDLFKETLDILQEEYSKEIYKGILKITKLKINIELPNDGKLISTFADELAERVRDENVFFYRSDTKEIVEIGKIKHPSGETIQNGFVNVKPNRFITLIERYFRPWSKIYTKYGQQIKNKSMNQTVSNIVLASDNFLDLMPVINRIFTVQIPIIYNGKLTFPNIGYDPRFGSWLSHNAPMISNMKMDIKEAKKIITYIFNEFCFKDKKDFTNAVAALLTPFIRGLFSGFNVRTPVFGYLANRERAGKDFCAGITGVLYEGVALEESPLSTGERGNNNDEIRKKILSAMIQGRKRFHSANNKGLLNNAVFEGITTATTYSDRLLGKNETVTLDNEIDYSFSGNIGMKLTPDLSNRCVFINLFLDIEDANSRKFTNPNLHSWINENRNLILSAIFSLVKHWFDKKMPKGSLQYASYPEWANICGGIMEATGYDNPCVKDKDVMFVSMDSETSDMKNLFELCFDNTPDTWLKKSDIRSLIVSSEEDVFSYIDWDNKSDQTKFGIKINSYVGRILSDIKLVVKDSSIRKSRWEYKFTKEEINFDKETIFGNLGNVGNMLPTPTYNTLLQHKTIGTRLPRLPTLPRPKSDREIQFWEADECKNIKPNHTKEEVLKWIKDNPKYKHEDMYNKFGIGSYKFENELKEEGLI